jgi:amino acid permease
MADWQALFDETGHEEPHAAWVYFTRAGAAAARRAEARQFIGALGVFSVTVNYILGVGALGVPFAFQQAGLSLSLATTMASCVLSFITVMFIVETHARAMLLSSSRAERSRSLSGGFAGGAENGRYSAPTSPAISHASPWNAASFVNPKSPVNTTKNTSNQLSSRPATPRKVASELTELLTSPLFYEQTDSPIIEVASLVKGAVGFRASVIYILVLSGLTSTGLWAYANVAANSFVDQVHYWPCDASHENYLGDCGWQYLVNGALFGVVVVPLSFLDMADQGGLQAVFTVLRFVTLGAMVLGSLLGIFFFSLQDAVPGGYGPSHHHRGNSSAFNGSTSNVVRTGVSNHTMVGPPFISETVTWAPKWSGFGMILSTMTFSMLFQHSVPGLMATIRPSERKRTKCIFSSALFTSAALYAVLGVSMCTYFGDRLFASSNLNFVGFTWGLGTVTDASTHTTRPTIFASVVSYIIVLFPVLSSVSVYPLIAITLSNNLHVATASCTGWAKDNKRAKLIWRFVAAVPPILLCAVIRDLSTIIQFSGLFAVPIAYIFPALLQRYSRRGASEFGQVPPAYIWHFNRHPIYVWVVIGIGILCEGVVIVQLVDQLSTHWGKNKKH